MRKKVALDNKDQGKNTATPKNRGISKNELKNLQSSLRVRSRGENPSSMFR